MRIKLATVHACTNRFHYVGCRVTMKYGRKMRKRCVLKSISHFNQRLLNSYQVLTVICFGLGANSDTLNTSPNRCLRQSELLIYPGKYSDRAAPNLGSLNSLEHAS